VADEDLKGSGDEMSLPKIFKNEMRINDEVEIKISLM
jgi:hypothetical protein